jgi:hypothetical protein
MIEVEIFPMHESIKFEEEVLKLASEVSEGSDRLCDICREVVVPSIR